MNCRPGDIAVIVCLTPYWNNRICEVLYATPQESFTLPDGYLGSETRYPAWIVRLVGMPAKAKIIRGDERATRTAWFGSVPDANLRPLRGDPDTQEIVTDEEITV
jgi:hypothetical protein